MRSHRTLARLAERQYGVVSVRQLEQLGFSSARIGRMARAERLRRIHRGVYAVGHRALPRRGRCLAAILACGKGAVLSHSSAAWLLDLAPSLPDPIDVTVPSHGQRHTGIALHHSATLTATEYGAAAGIPVTAWPRTMLDIAATRPAWELNDVLERAERKDVLDLRIVDALLHRRRGDRGVARLRLAVEIYRDPVFSRARSERLFLAMVKRAGLPRPAINTWVDKFEIDAYWEAERFAVEIDGWETHRTRQAFEDDHLRWEEMKLAGIEVVPISARRIEKHPAELGRRLRTLLERRRTDH